MSAPRIVIATNNGDIGGGEVMLLNIADALRSLGIHVSVVGPTDPGELVETAADRGFDTIALRASGRLAYMRALAAWRLRNLNVPLWCNGLVPSTATAGMGPRITHLHVLPAGGNRAAVPLAMLRARATLVPSQFMAERLPAARVLPNWTTEVPFTPTKRSTDGPLRVGFLGRLTRDKGVDVLAEAMSRVQGPGGRETAFVLAGANRFGGVADDHAISAALRRIEDRTEQLGWVPREAFFADIDLAIFPSVFPESFGLVVAEAMAAGVPFVISDAGALPEVAGVEHPWVARAGDAEHLASVITAALAASADERSRQAAVARGRWEENYSPAAGFQRVAALLSDLPLVPEHR